MNPFRWGLLALVAAATVIAIAVAVHPTSSDQTAPTTPGQASAGTALLAESDRVVAPDFTGIDGWLNSGPLTITGLRGRVVLVDFWTFSCVNCTRTIPHLQALAAMYRSMGLQIVGVHSPEFDFEKVRDNVAAATSRLGVTWPVALDSEMATWNAYANQYWPAEYLIDQQGRVAYVHFGEGNYDVTEAAVRELLHSTATPAAQPSAGGGGLTSPELYAGSQRGRLADGAAYGRLGQAVEYPDRGTPAQRDAIAVAGRWVDHGEYLEATSAGHVRLRFHAGDVFVVAAAAERGPLLIAVTVDGAPVPAGQRGPDLSAGSSFDVTQAGLQHVLTGIVPGDHVIDLAVPAGLRLYTFTFG
jgi:thiol-disulfide isomerase/thioredoxin